MLKERIKTLTTEAILSQLDVRFNIWKILKKFGSICYVISLYLSEEFELNRFWEDRQTQEMSKFLF